MENEKRKKKERKIGKIVEPVTKVEHGPICVYQSTFTQVNISSLNIQ